MSDEKQILEPPKTGIYSVRVAVYVAQLVVTGLLTYLTRRSLLSAELVEKIRNSPQLQVLVSLLSEGIVMAFIAGQAWVTHIFIKVSGLIAAKKIEQIGEYNKQLVIAASPNPATGDAPSTTVNIDQK